MHASMYEYTYIQIHITRLFEVREGAKGKTGIDICTYMYMHIDILTYRSVDVCMCANMYEYMFIHIHI
jgi:hypothetical protein